MGGRADELRAELTVLEWEDELVRLKEDSNVGPDSLEYREAKDALREARREHRTLRAGRPPEAGDGDAVVRPDPVEASTTVQSPGGAG